MKNFSDLPATQKGTYGENIVKNIFMDYGLICYTPQNENIAHPFDLILIDRNNLTMRFADVKTKPRRYVREDTGINIKHFNEYKKFADKYQVDFMIIFVDEYEKRIYGNSFRKLERSKQFIDGDYIYWKLEDMINICILTDKQVADLKSFV